MNKAIGKIKFLQNPLIMNLSYVYVFTGQFRWKTDETT